MQPTYLSLAQKIGALFSALPQVEAIAVGGSQGSGTIDAASDIDLYVYTRADIPLSERQSIVERSGGASQASLGLTFWGPGDEWIDAATGIEIDLVYFDAAWMESQINRALRDYQASLGYSTCFWYTVRHSQAFYDPNGWLANLQRVCQHPYPEVLRRNIIALNHPVLRNIIPSYTAQLEKAVKRHDLVSINHRLAALLASYFDILFAINREPHPGEKRLVEQALARCRRLPANIERDIPALLSASAGSNLEFLEKVTILLDHLDQLLEDEGFDPQSSLAK